jgi:hypothetical protein
MQGKGDRGLGKGYWSGKVEGVVFMGYNEFTGVN